MRRVVTPVTLAQAEARLSDYCERRGRGPHKPAHLAEIIWPDAQWVRPQGAGAAATRVLKRLGWSWTSTRDSGWGWVQP